MAIKIQPLTTNNNSSYLKFYKRKMVSLTVILALIFVAVERVSYVRANEFADDDS